MRYIKTLIWVVILAVFLEGAGLVVGICEMLNMEKEYLAADEILKEPTVGQPDVSDRKIDIGVTKSPIVNVDGKTDVRSINEEKNDGTRVEEAKKEKQPAGDIKNQQEKKTAGMTSAPVIKDEGDKKVVEGYAVDKVDYLKATGVILNKLSKDEIKYLFGRAKANNSKEELRKIREILLSKLTSEDVRILREIGKRYGKKLNILDPNVEIK